MIFFLLLGLFIGALSVVFALQNVIAITVTFLGWHIDGSLAAVLFVALASGMAVALLLLLPSFIGAEMRISRMRKEKEEVEKELAANKRILSDMVSKPSVTEIHDTTTTTTTSV